MKSAVLFLGLLLAISAVNQAAATGVIGALKEIHQAKAQLLQKFAPPPPSPPAAKVVPTPPVVVSGPRVAVSGARAQASPSPSPAAKAVLSPPVAKAVASPPPSLLSKLAAKATLGGGY